MAKYALDGRVVLITGGARGIGLDAATRLLAKGASIALVDRDEVELANAAKQLDNRERVAVFAADVTNAAAVQTAVDDAVAHFGGLDVVIAGAGISGKPAAFSSLSATDFKRVININVIGVYHTIRAALPYVTERQGYILPIASVAALIPTPFLVAYSASKHAVDGMARSLRLELAHTGVSVGVAYFSFIDTDMVKTAKATPVGSAALSILPDFLSKPIPVSEAGNAIVRGIEKRARWVYAPKWVPGLITLRGLSSRFEDLATRSPKFAALLREPPKK